MLTSLEDLEQEFAAGDLDDGDYQQLKSDYTVRAADLIRSIERIESGRKPSTKKSRVGSARVASGGKKAKVDRPLGRLVGTAICLLAFAVGAGWLLAQAVGERGASDGLTGALPESPREKVLACQQHMAEGELRDSLICFDEVLAEDPQNVEALTYKGWFLILASGSAQQAGDEEAFAEFVALGERSLADAVAVDPSFPDARAFRAVVFSRLGRDQEACNEIAVLNDLNPAPMITQLIDPVADRLACE